MEKPGLNSTNRKHLLDLVGTIVGALREHNMTFMMMGGTLLGSYRHHGLIPWDDDVDLVVDLHTRCVIIFYMLVHTVLYSNENIFN